MAVLSKIESTNKINERGKIMKNLSRSAPEKQGVKSQAIINFLNAVKENNQELHSFMLLKNGYVISECWWEPYAPQYRHPVYSLAKSITSTGIGVAVDEGLLTVDTLVADIFKKEMDELGDHIDEKIRKMTIKHLLTMTTGMEYDDWSWGNNNIKNFLSSHIKNEPGSKFYYHSFLAAYMESAAITRLTGQTMFDYLKPRLFEPLGIEAGWGDIDGVTFGCNYIDMTTEEIAKFGQLCLQKGNWNGRQLVSEKWIEEATTRKQVDNRGDVFGYHFGICKLDGVYNAGGWRGQYSIVMPNENSVIAVTSNTEGQVLDLIWDILLPALRENNMPNDDIAGYEKMKKAQKNLTHLNVNEHAEPFPKFSGEYKITDEKNVYHGVKKIYIESMADECVLAIHYKNSEIAGLLRMKNNEWFENTSAIHGFGYNGGCYRNKTFGEWKTDSNGDIFTVTHWHYENHEKNTIKIRFSGDKLKFTLQFDDEAISEMYAKI